MKGIATEFKMAKTEVNTVKVSIKIVNRYFDLDFNDIMLYLENVYPGK